MSSDQNLPTPFDGEQSDPDISAGVAVDAAADPGTLPTPLATEVSEVSAAHAEGLPTPFDGDDRTSADATEDRSTTLPSPLDGPGGDSTTADGGSGGDAALPVPEEEPTTADGGDSTDAGGGSLPRPDDESAPE